MIVEIIYQPSNQLVEAEIAPASISQIPPKEKGWNFNWKAAYEEKDSIVYALKIRNDQESVEGMIELKVVHEMLVMEILELAPHNIGSKNKRYANVAGCLIAFACRASYKLDGEYKGFLTFTSKTKLLKWYEQKYFAKRGMGQRMYINPDDGIKLSSIYLRLRKQY